MRCPNVGVLLLLMMVNGGDFGQRWRWSSCSSAPHNEDDELHMHASADRD